MAIIEEHFGSYASWDDLYSVDFDGVDEYIHLSGNPAIESTDFSITFWIKAPTQASFGTIISRGFNAVNPTGRFGYAIFLSPSNTIRFSRQEGQSFATGSYQVDSTNTVTPNAWNFVAITYDISTQAYRIRINGNSDTGTIGTGGNIVYDAQDNDTAIGIRHLISGNALPYDGLIDDMYIFTSLLSDAQLTAIYNSGCPKDESGSAQHGWLMGDPNGTSSYPTIPDVVGALTGTMTNQESGDINTDVPC